MLEFIIIAIIGLCLGSFVTAASYRLPKGEDIMLSSSKCPKCSYKLKPADLSLIHI
jgi:leader peptidase (prepilin peptidase)/N-methyltransferase